MSNKIILGLSRLLLVSNNCNYWITGTSSLFKGGNDLLTIENVRGIAGGGKLSIKIGVCRGVGMMSLL